MKPDELREKIEDGTLNTEDIENVIETITKEVQQESANEVAKTLKRVFVAGRMVGACETLKELNKAVNDDDPDANVSYGGTA